MKLFFEIIVLTWTMTVFGQQIPAQRPDCYLVNAVAVRDGIMIDLVPLELPGTGTYCAEKVSSGITVYVTDASSGTAITVWLSPQTAWPKTSGGQFVSVPPSAYSVSTREGGLAGNRVMTSTGEIHTSPVVVVGEPSDETRPASWDSLPWIGALPGGVTPNGTIRFQVGTIEPTEPGKQVWYGWFFQPEGTGGYTASGSWIAFDGLVGEAKLPPTFNLLQDVSALIYNPSNQHVGAVYKVWDAAANSAYRARDATFNVASATGKGIPVSAARRMSQPDAAPPETLLTLPASTKMTAGALTYVPVTLTLGAGVANLAGLQLQISWTPSNMVVHTPIAWKASQAAAKTVTCNMLAAPADSGLCLLTGINTNVFANGVVLLIPIGVGANFPGGTVTILNALSASLPGSAIPTNPTIQSGNLTL